MHTDQTIKIVGVGVLSGILTDCLGAAMPCHDLRNTDHGLIERLPIEEVVRDAYVLTVLHDVCITDSENACRVIASELSDEKKVEKRIPDLRVCIAGYTC
jgi:hypothetical protein